MSILHREEASKTIENSSFQVSYHQKVCSHQKCFLISFAADLRQGFGNRNTLKQLHL